MNQQNSVDSVLEAVAATLPRKDVAQPWKFLASELLLCMPPADPIRLLADLRQSHDDDLLVETGAARRISEKDIVLCDELANADNDLLIIRDERTGCVGEVLSQSGPLSGDPAVITCAARGESLDVANVEEDGPFVFAAFTLEDVAVLRACGIPATLANGLHCLSPDDAVRLCAQFHIPHSASSCHDDSADLDEIDTPQPSLRDEVATDNVAEEHKVLVLVGWRPAEMSDIAPESLAGVADYLDQLDRHMDIEFARCIQVWKPTAEDLERIAFFVGHRDKERFRDAVLESVSWNLHPLNLSAAKQQTPEKELNLLGALSDLQRAVLEPGSAMSVKKQFNRAWQRVEQQLNHYFVEPQVEQALLTYDPLERSLRLTAAATSRQPLQHRAYSENAAASRDNSTSGSPDRPVQSNRTSRAPSPSGSDSSAEVTFPLASVQHAGRLTRQVQARPKRRFVTLIPTLSGNKQARAPPGFDRSPQPYDIVVSLIA